MAFAPDAAIVNLYAPGARLGIHQDGEEPADAPVVTISLGDSCVFRLAGVDRRTAPFIDIEHAQWRPARVRGAQSPHLPRSPQGAPRHGTAGTRPPTGAAQHHRARDRAVVTAAAVTLSRCQPCPRTRLLGVVQPFEDVVAEHGTVVMRVCRALLGLRTTPTTPGRRRSSRLCKAYPRPAARQQRPGLAGDDRPPQGDRPDPVARNGIRCRSASSPRRRRRSVCPPPPTPGCGPRSRHCRSSSAARSSTTTSPTFRTPRSPRCSESSEAAARRSAADGIASLRKPYPKGTSA